MSAYGSATRPEHLDEEPEDDFDETAPYACPRCDGSGELLVCIDDMCRGAGECMHGDGMIACPACQGTGEIQP